MKQQLIVTSPCWESIKAHYDGEFHRAKSLKWSNEELAVCALNQFTRFWEVYRNRFFKKFGINEREFNILLSASHFGGAGFERKKLPKMLGLSGQATSNTITKLKLMKLLHTEKQTRVLRITAKGEALLKDIKQGKGKRGKGRKTMDALFRKFATVNERELLHFLWFMTKGVRPLMKDFGKLLGVHIEWDTSDVEGDHLGENVQ